MTRKRMEDDSYDYDLLPPWPDRFIVPGPKVVLFDSRGKPLKRPIGFVKEGKNGK